MSSSTMNKTELGGYQDRFWYPRFWDGMTLGVWLKTLKDGSFRVAPRRLGMAAIITALAPFNSMHAGMEKIIYGKRIANTKLVGPPIFIIGHWRSGTTLLHEYMIVDKQFSYADTYACFAPAHFLFSRYFMKPVASIIMPKKRPMDNMAAGLDRPQEDEFALCSLGIPSTYLNLLFANDKRNYQDYLTLRNLSDEKKDQWLNGFDWFLRCLTVQNPKQLILKSPPHTARISTILRKYPDAKFVHIHRHPYLLFPSTVNLWMRLSKDEGLQVPTGEHMEEDVLVAFEKMYDAFESDVPLLKTGQFADIGYDQLTSAPVDTLEKIYSDLQLSGFDAVKSDLEKFAATQKEYKKNKFTLNPEIKKVIADRWGNYFRKYGYSQDD